jgi:peptide/nickel transport system permease protein
MSAIEAEGATPPGATRTGRSRSSRIGLVGVIIVLSFAAIALASPWLAPYRPFALSGGPLTAPEAAHLLGTNGVGQDVFSQILNGAAASMFVAGVAGAGTLLVGVTVGVIAGWLGGRVDTVLMRITDMVLVIPRLPFLILVGAYLGGTLLNVSLVISLVFWPPTARILRSQVLSLRAKDHLRAAVGFGGGNLYVIRRHILPEIGLLIAASFVSSAGRAVSLEAGLAFLGLGDPSRVSWGTMMRDAVDFGGLYYTDAWQWWLLPPVVALTTLLLGLTFLGIALERRVNPRLARHIAGRP